jgi:hypothetical protein
MVNYHKLDSGADHPKQSERNKWNCTMKLRYSAKAGRLNPENKSFKEQAENIRNSVSSNLTAVIELSFPKRLNVIQYLEFLL